MLAIAYYSLFLVMGVIYADKIFKDKSTYFKLWSGGVIGNVALMFGIVPISMLLGFTRLAHILLAVLMVVPYLFIKKDFAFKLKRPDVWAFLCGGIICLIMFILFENHILVPVLGGLATGQSTYGDTAMHLGFISSIAESGKFPPEYNLLSGNKLCYPFLADSLSSSLYLLGASLRQSIMIPSFVLSALLVMGFYYFAESISNKKAAVLAMVLFFIGGGFGFIYFLDGILENPDNFFRIFTAYYETPTNYVEENIRWVNPICDMIIPQRTTMAGWCVLMLCLWLLVEAIKSKRRSLFVILGILAGSMPMIHTHSFLALVVVSAGCLVAFYSDSADKKEYLFNMGIYALVAFILSYGQLNYWTFSQSIGNESFLRFGFNWVNETDSYLWFWVKNLGITAVFSVVAWISQPTFNKKLSTGFIALFVLAEFVIFQPNEYDNNKLFFVTYMLFVIFVSSWLISVNGKLYGMKGRSVLAVFVLFLGVFSGALSICRELKSGGEYLFFTDDDVEFSEFVKNNTDTESVFLTASDHINPVSTLSGRKIYAGSELYVYFHGYVDEMYKRYNDLEKIYESKSISELKVNLDMAENVRYIVLSDREKNAYNINESVFDNIECIYDKGGIKLFDVSSIN